LQNLKYRPIEPYDIPIIQAMMQGNDSCYLPFGCFNKPLFVATVNNAIVGFSLGQKSYGERSDVLTVISTYLGRGYDDEVHQHELHLAFINWAEKSLGSHHYQLGEFGPIQPINISHVMPQQKAPVFENDTPHFAETALPHVEYV
jgi:hypothetical protein